MFPLGLSLSVKPDGHRTDTSSCVGKLCWQVVWVCFPRRMWFFWPSRVPGTFGWSWQELPDRLSLPPSISTWPEIWIFWIRSCKVHHSMGRWVFLTSAPHFWFSSCVSAGEKKAAPRSCSISPYRVGACPTAPVESQELLKPLSSQIDAHAILLILKLWAHVFHTCPVDTARTCEQGQMMVMSWEQLSFRAEFKHVWPIFNKW